MKLYSDVIDKKKERQKFKNDLKFNLYFTWKYLKSKFKSPPSFYNYIIKIVEDELLLGKQEMRFYIEGYNDKYENLLDIYRWYIKEYNKDDFFEYFTQNKFDATYEELYKKFNYDDILVEKQEDEDGEYISIRRNRLHFTEQGWIIL